MTPQPPQNPPCPPSSLDKEVLASVKSNVDASTLGGPTFTNPTGKAAYGGSK